MACNPACLAICFPFCLYPMVSLSLPAECKRCTKIVRRFVKIQQPGKGLPTDRYIPPNVLAKAKGVAILTAVKAGFLWGGCIGSGLVLARLPDGTWSAPSAIGLGSVSFGAQIGGEVIDLIIILNTTDAVKAFSHGGNIALGGQLSVALGPFGRMGGAMGSARDMAALYTYSKSKGLFAGLSIDGSVIMERTKATHRFYRRVISPKEILRGAVPVPPEAQDLIRALGGLPAGPPVVSCLLEPAAPSMAPPLPDSDTQHPIARALFDFPGDREGDLKFNKGDVITVLKRGSSQNEWWLGRCHGKEGSFPANYCDLGSHGMGPSDISRSAA